VEKKEGGGGGGGSEVATPSGNLPLSSKSLIMPDTTFRWLAASLRYKERGEGKGGEKRASKKRRKGEKEGEGVTTHLFDGTGQPYFTPTVFFYYLDITLIRGPIAPLYSRRGGKEDDMQKGEEKKKGKGGGEKRDMTLCNVMVSVSNASFFYRGRHYGA